VAALRIGRRSGLVLRGGKTRRATSWIALTPVSNTLASGSVAVLSASLNVGAEALLPFTVVRARGFFHVRSDQGANTEFYHAVLGMQVVTAQAVTAGITAVPTPDTERDSDTWFVFEELGGEVQVNTSVGFNDPGGQWVKFDSRAMRKVDEGQDVIVVKETSSISLGAIAVHGGRMLIKLH